MLILTYSKESAPSAQKIAEVSNGRIQAVRRSDGDINWGRARANTTLNPDISNATNKRIMRELFLENAVPTPAKIDVDDPDGGWTFPIVGRPDSHTRKRGYWLCNNWDDVKKSRQGTRLKRAATHFMEFIEADAEFRVHIFKGKSIRISQKKFSAGNIYTMVKPTGNVKQVRKAAKRAVKALGLDLGAVDVLRRGDEAFALEVNAAPGVGGSMPKVYAEHFIAWKERDVRN